MHLEVDKLCGGLSVPQMTVREDTNRGGMMMIFPRKSFRAASRLHEHEVLIHFAMVTAGASKKWYFFGIRIFFFRSIFALNRSHR